MQAEIANLCILIMIAFYGKGNIGFKTTQRHLEAAPGTPKFQTSHYMFITQLWADKTQLDAKSSVR